MENREKIKVGESFMMRVSPGDNVIKDVGNRLACSSSSWQPLMRHKPENGVFPLKGTLL